MGDPYEGVDQSWVVAPLASVEKASIRVVPLAASVGVDPYISTAVA